MKHIQDVLRGSFSKYNESHVIHEISNFFIFCINQLYSELLLKKPFKGSEALSCLQN